MSRADHFLSRLVRLADDEVKLALALYHDSGWVRHLLGAASLPEVAERVALSLDDPRRGPFVVVTRGGHFVTCLARDMSPGRLPVVARGRLDTSGRSVDRERERALLEDRMHGGDASLRALLRRLFFEPDSISREDFQDIAAWEPLLGPTFLNTYIAMGSELAEQSRILCRKRLARRASTEMLHEYWNLLHATGHLALLGAMTADRDGYDALADELPGARSAFSYPLTGTGVTRFMLQGAWAAGRVGKPMLAAYKRALAEDVALFELFDSLLVLLMLGRRSSKLSAEIRKAVSSAPERATTPEARVLREQCGREIGLICGLTISLLDAPRDELDEMLLRVGDSYFDRQIDRTSDDDVRDVALTLPLLSWVDGITDGKKLSRTLSLAAAAAELPAERFYLPCVALAECREPWEPNHTWAMLEPMTRTTSSTKPKQRQGAKVGRNAPCPCGSGKKFKRCCAT